MTNNLASLSDTHIGCTFGLCSPQGFRIDNGVRIPASPLQLKMWDMFRYYWDEWIPVVSHDEPYDIEFGGDMIDGVHHNTTTQFSQNKALQRENAVEILAPEFRKAQQVFLIRGTEAHAGITAEDEETMGKMLKDAGVNIILDESGRHTRDDLYIRVGKSLIHCCHHIGGTVSAAFETTAIMRECVNAWQESGRWHEEAPDIIVRHHRHRFSQAEVSTEKGYGIGFVTAGWQLKTPLCFRISGIKFAPPQLGGSFIRQGDREAYAVHKVWTMKRPKIEGEINAGA